MSGRNKMKIIHETYLERNTTDTPKHVQHHHVAISAFHQISA